MFNHRIANILQTFKFGLGPIKDFFYLLETLDYSLETNDQKSHYILSEIFKTTFC